MKEPAKKNSTSTIVSQSFEPAETATKTHIIWAAGQAGLNAAQCPSFVAEPTVRAKALETLGHVHDAHRELDRLDEAMFGMQLPHVEAETEPVGLDATLAELSRKTAMLVGRISTINLKF